MKLNGRHVSPEDAEAIERYRDERAADEVAHSDAYREASKRLFSILDGAALFILHARDASLATWQVCYAMGLPICGGVSMHQRAPMLGVKPATLSKGAKAFQRAHQLPPSEYMKDAEATKVYADKRHEQVRKKNS